MRSAEKFKRQWWLVVCSILIWVGYEGETVMRWCDDGNSKRSEKSKKKTKENGIKSLSIWFLAREGSIYIGRSCMRIWVYDRVAKCF